LRFGRLSGWFSLGGAALGQERLAVKRDSSRSTFELSGRRRHGALDSKRKMGRSPSA